MQLIQVVARRWRRRLLVALRPTITATLPDGILNLAVAAGLASSNSEARKLIGNGGLKLNDAVVSDPKFTVDASALNSDGVLKLSSGKKKHVLVKPA